MIFKKLSYKYEKELLESVIPFWEKNCIDSEFGGYFTFLDREGSVFNTEKFMWMQWRIVYMFAVLYMSRYKNDKWLDIAEQGFDFLSKNGKDKNGFYYFSLSREGEPSTAPYSIYSDCFAAMGSAALYKATGNRLYLDEANHTMANYIKRLDNPKGRWEKSLSGKPSRVNLGHYMMLANLGNIMKEYLDTAVYDSDTENSVHTVMDKFRNDEFRITFEYVNQDGSFDLESCDGRHIIPGHGLESMWFIMKYAEKHENRELIEKASQTVLGLLEFGWDKKYGGIFYFMDVLGKPHIELQADMKLWWVHNEALIAALYAYRLSGKEIFLEWFQKLDKWTWEHFPDPESGEWFGYLNREGTPSHFLKGGKWKTFFHLPRFLLVSLEQFRLLTRKKRGGGRESS